MYNEDNFNSENNGFRPRRKTFRKPFNNNREGNSQEFRPRQNRGEGFSQEFRPRQNRPFHRPFRQENGESGEQTRQPRPRIYRNNFNNSQPNSGERTFRPKPSVYSKKKQLEHRKFSINLNEPMRLNKFIANSGVCSRREADEYILAGVISVNGQVVTELGMKITPAIDKVMFHDQPIRAEKKVYILLNKPKNCVTTLDDPKERFTVLDLVKNACKERIFPVGRLDRNSTGVLLLTNDGEMSMKLTHPRYNKKKIYQVTLDKPISSEEIQKLLDGIELEDGEIKADEISFVKEGDFTKLGVEIHSGRNRIVRRMFDKLGYTVIRLDRVFFAGLTKKNLQRGKWRFLNEKEVNMLRMGAYE